MGVSAFDVPIPVLITGSDYSDFFYLQIFTFFSPCITPSPVVCAHDLLLVCVYQLLTTSKLHCRVDCCTVHLHLRIQEVIRSINKTGNCT